MDSRALVAAAPLLQSSNSYGQPQYSTFDPDPAPSADQDASPQQSLSIASLEPGDAVRFFLLAVRAAERRHDLAQASSIVQSALDDLRDPALRKPFEKEQKRLADELSREGQNDQRVPNVHAELVQDRLVLPRLVVTPHPFMPLQIHGMEEQP
jgi:hypothetical protein